MAVVDRDTAIIFSKNKICKDAADLACGEVFGTANKDKEWSKLMLRYLATSMIEDTDGQTLSGGDRQCVINFISGTL